jgi:hypothetical protein
MLKTGSGCREEDNETVEGIDGCGVAVGITAKKTEGSYGEEEVKEGSH